MECLPLSRLIIISNRVQPPTGEGGGNQGGLAVALSAALREYSGLWFGWSGETVESFTGQINFHRAHGVTTATVDLEEHDFDEYYNGFANRTLWPLFHYRLDLTRFEREFRGGYQRVNERFADTVTPLIEPDDLVWVHDYHLIPLGQELRARGLANRLGFFLHIPWPPTQLLRSLPQHRELVETLFAYDVIGFHTEEWLESFLHYVTSVFGAALGPDGLVTVGERSFRAISCPIGIDTENFVAAADSGEARQAAQRMLSSRAGRNLIVGVDRLDYSKGLPERFLGYERFLQRHPECRAEVSFLQIAPPSRETVDTYLEIRAQLDGLSGRVNGEFAEIDWVPLRYVNQGYGRETLAGLYRAARMALVTPLRDGMNLVAKEFVAAQDPEDPGVLILSRFAGAAHQLSDALLVNPYSADEIGEAINTALHMPRGERTARWRRMMDNVEGEDVLWWRRRFTDALEAVAVPAAAAA